MSEGMKIELTSHAEKRLAVRKIDRQQVIGVALAPEQIITKEGELSVAQSRITFMNKEALLRVVFDDEDETRWIVTAYITTQVRRYWQEESEQDED
jgi:hypothetical protein